MKKKIISILTIFIIIFALTGCGEKDSMAFKKDYESLNGKANASGKIHRSVTISEDNPFIEVSAEEIVKKIENDETFYVYFGSKLCPWCRSSIEKADEFARRHGITKIYYVDIWDDDGNEILRDKYKLEENKPVLEKEGTAAYKKLLEYFDSLLKEYTLTDSDGNKINVGEKRIFAPNYVYVSNGEAKKLVSGTSPLQKDSREELTKEILADQEKIFDDFFTEACDEAC